MKTLSFTIPRQQWLSANQRLHWATRSTRVKTLRELAYWTALASGMKNAGLTGTKVTVNIYTPSRRRFDADNAAPTWKALCDGLVDAGVWVDDSQPFIKSVTYQHAGLSGASGVFRIDINIYGENK